MPVLRLNCANRQSTNVIQRYQAPPAPLQPRMSASKTIVPITETAIEPRQPRRFEKNANIRLNRIAACSQPSAKQTA